MVRHTTLDEWTKVLDEYRGGTKVAIQYTDSEDQHVVVRPNGERFKTGLWKARHRSKVVACLCEEHPNIRLYDDEPAVPTKIALSDQHKLIAYLYGVKGWKKPEIAAQTNIQTDSVSSYISRFLSDQPEPVE